MSGRRAWTGVGLVVAIIASTSGMALLGEGAMQLVQDDDRGLRQGDEFHYTMVVHATNRGLAHEWRNALTVRVGETTTVQLPGQGGVEAVPIQVSERTPPWRQWTNCVLECRFEADQLEARVETHQTVYYRTSDFRPVYLESIEHERAWGFQEGEPHVASYMWQTASVRPDTYLAGVGDSTTRHLVTIDLATRLTSLLTDGLDSALTHEVERTRYKALPLVLATREHDTAESDAVVCSTIGTLASYRHVPRSTDSKPLSGRITNEAWVQESLPLPTVFLCQAEFRKKDGALVDQVEFGLFLDAYTPGHGERVDPRPTRSTPVMDLRATLTKRSVAAPGLPDHEGLPALLPLREALEAALSHQPALDGGLETANGTWFALASASYTQFPRDVLGQDTQSDLPRLPGVSTDLSYTAVWHLTLLDAASGAHQFSLHRDQSFGTPPRDWLYYHKSREASVSADPDLPHELVPLGEAIDHFTTHVDGHPDLRNAHWGLAIEHVAPGPPEAQLLNQVEHEAIIWWDDEAPARSKVHTMWFDLDRGYPYQATERSFTVDAGPYGPTRAVPTDQSPAALRGAPWRETQYQPLTIGLVLSVLGLSAVATLGSTAWSYQRRHRPPNP